MFSCGDTLVSKKRKFYVNEKKKKNVFTLIFMLMDKKICNPHFVLLFFGLLTNCGKILNSGAVWGGEFSFFFQPLAARLVRTETFK